MSTLTVTKGTPNDVIVSVNETDVVVTQGNNITVEVTPTPITTLNIDKGIIGPQGPQGPAGQGLASGGTTGQVLYKTSNADYATGWETLGTMASQNANSVAITGGSISGATVSGYIPTTQKGVADGVATLDSSGLVPISQLPPLGDLNYQGTWNASTNTPTLTSSVGTKGYYYVVSVAGSTNLNGITDWLVNDWAVYNGTAWQKIDNTDSYDPSNVAITGGSVNSTSQSNTTIANYENFTPTTAPTYTEGRVWYDSTEKALAFYNDSSALAVHVGQDLIVKVINNTGTTIPNGSPVYVTGTSSGQTYPNVALAKADIAATSAVIGLTNGAIANGAIGYVTSQGTIDNVNTSTFTVGQVLYLSPYSAGQLMNTIPPTGITVQVGVVTFVNSSTGHIYVKQTTPLAVPASIITGQVAIANGGTGASTASGARTNLGLGTIATQDANSVAITGGAIDGTTIGATTASTGKFTSVTTPSVTATTTDLTLSAISTGAVNFNTVNGRFFAVTDGGAASANYWTATGNAVGNAVFRSIGTGANAFIDNGSANSINFRTNGAIAGAEQFRVGHTASAVNYVQVTGAATTGRPIISAQGSDTNISIGYDAKNAGGHNFKAGGNTQVLINNSASAVNSLNLTGSATTQAIPLSATGTDTNISMAFQPKGTGAIDLAAGSSGINISNGGTVTALTRTGSGFNYTTQPSIAISAPTTAGGVQATATQHMYINTATVVSGGTGYTLNDVLTVSGGTPVSSAATLTVTGVTGGVITSVSSTNFALYSALPSSPISVTGGTGTGATFTPLWGNGNSFTITNAGSGYIEQPTVTFSGGGGSGAAAYATVGSDTVVRSLGNNMAFYTPNQQIAFRISDGAGFSSTGYWTAYGGTASPILRAVGATSGQIQTSSAVPVQFITNVGTSGAEQFRVSHTASAVNYVQVTGNATANFPSITFTGSDSGVGGSFISKGTGSFSFYSNGGLTNRQVRIDGSLASVNYLDLYGNIAGSAPSIRVAGTDTDIDLTLTPKNAGLVRFGTYTAGALLATGYINIKAANGTTYKVLVST